MNTEETTDTETHEATFSAVPDMPDTFNEMVAEQPKSPQEAGAPVDAATPPSPPEPPLFERGDRVRVDGRGLGYVTGVTEEGCVHVSLDQMVSSGGFGIGGAAGSRDHVCAKAVWVEKVRAPRGPVEASA